jgi:hypothetical protein
MQYFKSNQGLKYIFSKNGNDDLIGINGGQ